MLLSHIRFLTLLTVLGILLLVVFVPLTWNSGTTCGLDIAKAQEDNPCLAQEATISAMLVELQRLGFQATLDANNYTATISALESSAFSRTAPTPTVATNANTPPGTILEVGETWKQDGISLTMTDVVFTPGGYRGDFHTQFEFYNGTTSTLLFEVSLDTFSAVDNLGNHFTDQRFHQLRGTFSCSGGQYEIEPGERRQFCDGYRLFFKGSLTNAATTEVIVTVREISRIQNARWRFPITH